MKKRPLILFFIVLALSTIQVSFADYVLMRERDTNWPVLVFHRGDEPIERIAIAVHFETDHDIDYDRWVSDPAYRSSLGDLSLSSYLVDTQNRTILTSLDAEESCEAIIGGHVSHCIPQLESNLEEGYVLLSVDGKWWNRHFLFYDVTTSSLDFSRSDQMGDLRVDRTVEFLDDLNNAIRAKLDKEYGSDPLYQKSIEKLVYSIELRRFNRTALNSAHVELTFQAYVPKDDENEFFSLHSDLSTEINL